VKENEDSEFAEIAKAIANSLSADKIESPKSRKSPTPVPVVESSKDEESDGWIEAEPLTPNNNFFEKWHQQLAQLSILGFVDSETYIKFLEEENGDLDRVISRIISRNA